MARDCSFAIFKFAIEFCCYAELNDGSVLFSFGDEAEAKAKSAAAPLHSKSQQHIQGTPQASQEQSQLPVGSAKTQSSSKQDMANSSMPNLHQAAPKAPRPMTARARQAAAPAIDPKVIAKYTRLAVTPNLPVSGSTGPSSSSFNASQSVSSVASQRPTSPAVAMAALSNSDVGIGKTVSQAPSQGPGQKAKPAIDPKIIAKYSHRAVTSSLPASGSTGSSSSNAVSNGSSQRPSLPANPSSSGVESGRSVSQVPSQRLGSPKPAIDPAVIAKYSRRAVTPALPPSASNPSSSSFNATRSARGVTSQHPSSPAAAPASPSMSNGDASRSVSKAHTQRPQSPAVASPSPSPSSSNDDVSKSLSKAPTQRPPSPATASYSLSSLGLDDSSMSSSQAPRQRSASRKPPIDPKIIAKYSRRAVTQGPPASRSEVAEPEGRPASADTSDEKASSSEAASERLADMTPQQLQALKVRPLSYCNNISMHTVIMQLGYLTLHGYVMFAWLPVAASESTSVTEAVAYNRYGDGNGLQNMH